MTFLLPFNTLTDRTETITLKEMYLATIKEDEMKQLVDKSEDCEELVGWLSANF